MHKKQLLHIFNSPGDWQDGQYCPVCMAGRSDHSFLCDCLQCVAQPFIALLWRWSHSTGDTAQATAHTAQRKIYVVHIHIT